MTTILEEVYFLPPIAVARVGNSPEPVAAYDWVRSREPHGGSRTMVRLATSLRVLDDGSVEPYRPVNANNEVGIAFKDEQGQICPVAPFFELWASVRDAQSPDRKDVPLTLAMLEELGLTPDHFAFTVTTANRKAERRTGSPTCAFIARVDVHGSNYAATPLLAISPHTSGQVPLVPADRPIPLGSFQVIRPVSRTNPDFDVDVSAMRVRFTPPKGEVYGPPAATSAPASPVPPGVAEAHNTDYGRIHEIVPEKNRILNADTPWSHYVMLTGQWEDSQPQDGYDGANVGDSRSWGVVDDTSDGEIVARVAWRHRRFQARARFFTGPPDYAPDRRPVYSIADDLAERELPPPSTNEDDLPVVTGEVLDMFERAFETASLFNLDAARTRAIQENEARLSGSRQTIPDAPKYDGQSFTASDTPYVDVSPSLVMSEKATPLGPLAATTQLPYTELVNTVHGSMMQEEVLLRFLRRRGDHALEVIRPPFGTTADWPVLPGRDTNPLRRDPRLFVSKLHDMRMPPYMRDANFFPLSIGRRQYQLLQGLIELLRRQPKIPIGDPPSPEIPAAEVTQ